ncbi:mobile mystery protein B [soil metagenome]
MSDPLFDTSDGNTPIDEDEADGLRLSWVRTRGDLNDAEAANILESCRAIHSPPLDEVLDDLWLRRLGKRMFGDVWSWACRTWVAHDDTRSPVARFHHRLVAIHPFPNGNGRHSRAAADYLSSALGLPPPTWGTNTFEDTMELRAAYLRALRTADRDPDDLDPVVDFIWS